VEAVDRLAVERSRGVARAVGLVVTAGGLVASVGWLLDVAPLAAFGPSPLPPMRLGTGLALAACGAAVLAAAAGRHRAQQGFALLAAVLSLLVVVESVTGAEVSPYGLVRRLGLVATDLELAAPEPTASSCSPPRWGSSAPGRRSPPPCPPPPDSRRCSAWWTGSAQ
jgi:hypothetical protein